VNLSDLEREEGIRDRSVEVCVRVRGRKAVEFGHLSGNTFSDNVYLEVIRKGHGHRKEENIQQPTRNIQCPRQEKHRNIAQVLALLGNVCLRFPIFGWIFLVRYWILKSPRRKHLFGWGLFRFRWCTRAAIECPGSNVCNASRYRYRF
jgi:hypothetical protein